MQSVIFRRISIKIGISTKNSAKIPNMNFQENPSSGSHQDMRGSTDGHDDANSHISPSGFAKRADH